MNQSSKQMEGRVSRTKGAREGILYNERGANEGKPGKWIDRAWYRIIINIDIQGKTRWGGNDSLVRFVHFPLLTKPSIQSARRISPVPISDTLDIVVAANLMVQEKNATSYKHGSRDYS